MQQKGAVTNDMIPLDRTVKKINRPVWGYYYATKGKIFVRLETEDMRRDVEWKAVITKSI